MGKIDVNYRQQYRRIWQKYLLDSITFYSDNPLNQLLVWIIRRPEKNSLRLSNIIHKSIKSLMMFTTTKCENKHDSYMPRLLLYSLFICEQNI